MERYVQLSPEIGYQLDGTDAEYISGLSTLLTATIQETKESVSQIEYLFCKQLFPDFQLKLRKIYSEAKKAAEDKWKEKENDLIIQVNALQFEKQKVFEENQFLKLENRKLKKMQETLPKHANALDEELKRKTKEIAERRELQQSLRELLDSKASMVCSAERRLKEIEEENNLLQKKIHAQDLEVEGLKLNLGNKCRIIEEKEESNSELLQLVQSKVLVIKQKEQELKDNDQKMNGLFTKLQSSDRIIDEVRQELAEKTEQLDKGKELQERLLIKMETQASELMKTRQLLDDCETDNRVLTDKLRILENNCNGLQEAFQEKNKEVVEERKKQQQLIQQIGSNHSEFSRIKQNLEELQNEKRSLIGKLNCLEEKVVKLEADLQEKSNESNDGMELHGKLLQQIEGKNSEIMSEKKKRREVIDAYKKLKSQYNYLCSKSGLTPENMHCGTSTKVDKDSPGLDQNLLTSPGLENKTPKSPVPACDPNVQNQNQHNLADDEEFRVIQRSSSCSPSHESSPLAPHPASNKKSSSLSGTKRPASHWRNTRPAKSRNGPDPHDDFLDTPLENIKGNLSKPLNGQEIHHLPGPVPKDMNFDSSDDETQDVSADRGLQKQKMPSPPRPEKKCIKYVEPVRKKAERDNLKGIECKQCKKFYDAVLPDAGGNTKQNLRCEHHEGVSRHRYRFAPPLTPEGFWNIGFESEM